MGDCITRLRILNHLLLLGRCGTFNIICHGPILFFSEEVTCLRYALLRLLTYVLVKTNNWLCWKQTNLKLFFSICTACSCGLLGSFFHDLSQPIQMYLYVGTHWHQGRTYSFFFFLN